MLKSDVLAALGTQPKVAEVARVHQSTVSRWPPIVPMEHAVQIYRHRPDIPLRLAEDYGLEPAETSAA